MRWRKLDLGPIAGRASGHEGLAGAPPVLHRPVGECVSLCLKVCKCVGMNSIFIPSLYVLAGCTLLSAIHHAFLAARLKFKGEYLLFAASALAVAVDVYLRAATHNADSIADLVNLRRIEIIFTCLAFIALTWFFACFNGVRAPRFLVPLTGVWLLLIAASIIRPLGLHFDELPAQLYFRYLPWGEAVIDLSKYKMSSWFLAGWLTLIVSMGFCFYTVFRRAKQVGFASTSYTLVALSLFNILVLTNLAVLFQLAPIVQTSDFAFPALILMMHYRLASRPEGMQRQLYEVLGHLPIAFSQKDTEGNYLFTNSAFRSLAGDDHPIFPDDKSIFGERLADKFRAIERELLKTGTEAESDYMLEYRGEQRHIKLLQFPITDIEGQRNSICSIHIDTTEDRAKEDLMRRMRLQLWRADRLSNSGAISRSLAHELSQPLTAILNNAQAALRFMDQGTMDMDELSEILNDIVTDDKRAGAVINNLRNMLQSIEIPHSTQAIDEVLQESLSFLNTELIEHSVDVNFSMDQKILVHANRTHLQQVMINLIMNAMEAMEQSVHSPVLLLSAVKQADTVLVSVQDNGKGIPANKLEAVFESHFTTKPKGLGIGLEVCRAIIEAHGGKIWATANTGDGVTFSFILPLAVEHFTNLEK